MRTIWKYPLKDDLVEVEMPRGAQILSVQTQAEQIMLWALVDPEAAIEKRKFGVCGTGWEFASDFSTRRFLGTVQLQNGALVFHVFELAMKDKSL